MRLLLLAVLLTSVTAFAQPDCDGRALEHPEAALLTILKDAVSKGVLRDGDLRSFAHVAEWTNPFLTSSRHLLTPRYTLIFSTLEVKMTVEQKRQLKDEVLELLKDRGRDAAIKAKAMADTSRVLAPILAMTIPIQAHGFEAVRTGLVEGKIDGRPVFRLNARVARTQLEIPIALDPFSKDTGKIVCLENVEVSPQFTLNGQQFEFQEEEVRVGLNGTGQLVFRDRADVEISEFTLLPGTAFSDPRQFSRIFTYNGRHLAVFTLKDTGYQHTHAYVVDLATGKEVMHGKIGNSGKYAALIEQRGRNYLFWSNYKRIPSSRAEEHIVYFKDIDSGAGFARNISGPRETPMTAFRFHDREYLIYADFKRLKILDIEDETVMTVTETLEDPILDLKLFEWKGDSYLLVLSQNVQVFQLTRSSRE